MECSGEYNYYRASFSLLLILLCYKDGACLRFLRIENNVRCFDFNSERLVTGDDDGYIVFWDLKKCLDPEAGPDSLSYRSHNTYVEVSTWTWTLSLT